MAAWQRLRNTRTATASSRTSSAAGSRGGADADAAGAAVSLDHEGQGLGPCDEDRDGERVPQGCAATGRRCRPASSRRRTTRRGCRRARSWRRSRPELPPCDPLPAWTSGAPTRGMTGARRLGRTVAGASRLWCAGPSGTAMGWVGPRPVRCEAPPQVARLVSAENAVFNGPTLSHWHKHTHVSLGLGLCA